MTPWFLIMVIFYSHIPINVGQQYFRCLSKSNSQLRLGPNNDEVIINVSNDTLHQLISRIFQIYLIERLGYSNVTLKPIPCNNNHTETEKTYLLLEEIAQSKKPTLNLAVWMPADYHLHPPNIQIADRLSKGRFGWFVPKKLINNNDLPSLNPYTIFKDPNSTAFRQFLFDSSLLHKYNGNCIDCMNNNSYIPDHCNNVQCVTLLSSYRCDTSFVIEHINALKLYVKVLWLGKNLKSETYRLLQKFTKTLNETDVSKRQKFLVLHHTPSEIIDGNITYEMITMPECDEITTNEEALCKYELTPILKYHSKQLSYENDPLINTALKRISFDRNEINEIFKMYEQKINPKNNINWMAAVHVTSETLDEIACDWMRQYTSIWSNWNNYKSTINIAGIFPNVNESKEEFYDIIKAVNLSEEAIRKSNILPFNLIVLRSDGGCRLDTVMKTFINYYKQPVIGLLGPPCSETLEPIAGLSKHAGTAMISYAAEGASFTDRKKYPNFFATVGDNRQYEQVYVELFQRMDWKRVVALSEDGQKYTEYISQMEHLPKDKLIELKNKKFPKSFTDDKMKKYLQELKEKYFNIIIADIYDEPARMLLCEAYKLNMTAKDGYVWFLPISLQKQWNEKTLSKNINCTVAEISEMLNGHFSLSHAPYATDDSIMQENITVKEWKNLHLSNSTSHYSGYVYDAVWVYAYALDKLIKESASDLLKLYSRKSIKRLNQLISETNFNGVSGKIQFGEGGARFSIIEIRQWINKEHKLIGTFDPTISNDVPFKLNISAIQWLHNGIIPNDGRKSCIFSNLLGLDCNNTQFAVVTILFVILVLLISMVSFMFFFKRRYDNKLKASAKVMRNFGIDLLALKSMPPNALDKWEVSKDRVVINRGLGEGAFGTVYGGEAQIDNNGWTAVAVKTLKKGSSTEDRLDFLSEAEAMKRFDHTNIIKLLGVCLQSEPIYTIMEFMLYGDLKTYLLARRHLVNEKISDDSDISPKRLTMMALDVARALSYLADVKYVHRDVACRNCLVNAQRVVKLGDFGMARPTFDNDYYRFSRKGMLPVRWMAPESLNLGIFTPASDVWSFGILLFEIVTFGSFPFQGLANKQVLEYLKTGNTLAIPSGIKPQLEGLMNACWNLTYKNRPSASEVADFISNYPKLLTPSLDVPLASVQMGESESDELELLPGLRRNTQPTEIVQTPPAYNNIDGMHLPSTLPNSITLKEFLLPDDDFGLTPNRNLSNAYNPIEPLLQHDAEIAKSNLNFRRYVPMYGYKKGNKSMVKEGNSAL